MNELANYTTPFLPDEIIINILKRLPVKSLIRFQCLSKYWKNHIIKSPYFIEEHLHHNNQKPRLLFKCRHGRDPLNLSIIIDYETDDFIHVQKPPSLTNLSRAFIIGSCNGLICVRYFPHAFSMPYISIWNPATRKVRLVPRVAFDDVIDGLHFGFGFSPILNDYKIVKIFKPHMIRQVQVYSFNTDSWRDIGFENVEGVQIFGRHSVSINGYIFWYVSKISSEKIDVIVSFDVTMEVFTIMALSLDTNLHFSKVIEINKKPVLVCYTGMGVYESDFHFWAMEEVVNASSKEWRLTKMDNSSPCLSNNMSPAKSVLARCGDERVLRYVESLVPVARIFTMNTPRP